jgi:hypothetical protein
MVFLVILNEVKDLKLLEIRDSCCAQHDNQC